MTLILRSDQNRRTIFHLSTTSFVLFLLLVFNFHSLSNSFAGSSSNHTSSGRMAAGWHGRARVFEGAITPTEADIVLTVLMSSMGQSRGFTLSLLRPNLAVDASGRTLIVDEADFAAFEEVIGEVKKLPMTDGFRGQWRVKRSSTCQPFDRVLIPGEQERSVYGWSAKTDVLEKVTNGYEKLPGPLNVLLEWAREAREGYGYDQRDNTVLGQVLALVKEG